jgi:UDP-N-acetyl-D-mannosaminuronic acid dehydrogenase
LYGKISIIGLGYIGLPTAAIFADAGVEVLGVDVDERVIASINSGSPHFAEPKLDSLLRRVVDQGKLRASRQPEPADAFIIAVPTPFSADHAPDLQFVESAARAIAPVLKPGDLVVLESTSPVGTTEKLSQWLAEVRGDLSFPHQKGELSDIRVAHCPERVLPGRILEEVVNNPRVIGGITRRCSSAALSLYKLVVHGECHATNSRTAELAKLAENAFRDINIAYANELSMLCDSMHINVWELIELANLHPRVSILKPGPGVGGHCIAVDPWFIVHSNPVLAQLIATARQVNDRKPLWVVDKIAARASAFKSPLIACFGLSYKANIDDLRESPSIAIVKELAERNIGRLVVVEPNISKLSPQLMQLGVRLEDFNVALREADIAVLLVDHESFAWVDRNMLKDKVVIDTRGIW